MAFFCGVKHKKNRNVVEKQFVLQMM